ncbi:activator-dependent family glycosyltransferase [Nocardiopsis xinjiangensis]|uniref:activator-dependent family glycosyltransferase n=1 Tax=Nocardiopsis xinjiangensis TaxID=124285 RepID=UPI00034CAC20|nr:activator-dependent family glycosyltransferase [Nocardiopsis xinjiangensis]
MRVLLVTTPQSTIFYPMVPLAWALRTAGHDVRVASYPNFADTVTQAGLTAVPVGRRRDLERPLPGQTPELVELARAGLYPPWDVAEHPERAQWNRMLEGYFDTVQQGCKVENFPMIAGLVEFARQWQPDLVLWEPFAYAGSVAAAAIGAAHGRVLFGVDVFGVARERFLELREQQPEGERVDPLREWLEGYGRKYGFEFSEDLVTGQFTVDPVPDSLGVRADELEYVPMRYVPYGGRSVVPRWLRERPGRPRVAVTLGVTATGQRAYASHMRKMLEGVAELGVDVVATVPEAEQEKVGPVPDNVRMVSYVPLADLAATCDAVVNHAGPGTFLTMAAHGVPQLTLPWEFDEPLLARRAGGQGGSLVLHPTQADGDTVREAVDRLLDEPVFGERAAVLAAEVGSLPSPNQVAEQLESRVSGGVV